MTVEQLIARLNEIVKANPDNAKLEVIWYNSYEHYPENTKDMKIDVLLDNNSSSKRSVCMMNSDDAIRIDKTRWIKQYSAQSH